MSISFLTASDPDSNKKIDEGLHSELQALTSVAVDDFITHNIHAHSGDTFVGGAIVLKFGDILWIDSVW